MSASPADDQAQANEEVERIAQALYHEVWCHPWDRISETQREAWRAHARSLLRQGVIRPGVRPRVEPPMAGQTTIDEALDERA
jgi:hypothetical protein